jgi:hypothetical protein
MLFLSYHQSWNNPEIICVFWSILWPLSYMVFGFGMISPTLSYGWGKRNRVVSGYLLHFVPRRTPAVDWMRGQGTIGLINLGLRPMVLRRTAQLQKNIHMVRKIESRPTFFLPSTFFRFSRDFTGHWLQQRFSRQSMSWSFLNRSWTVMSWGPMTWLSLYVRVSWVRRRLKFLWSLAILYLLLFIYIIYN